MAAFFSILVSLLLMCITGNHKNTFTTASAERCKALNRFVTCYKVINITVELDNWPNLILKYSAFGEIFKLMLEHPDNQSSYCGYHQIASNINVTVVNQEGPTSFNYKVQDCVFGHVEGIPDSRVHGRYSNNIFSGVVHTTEEIYYIENESKYIKGSVKDDLITYRASDVIPDSEGCSSTKIMDGNDVNFLHKHKDVLVTPHEIDYSHFLTTMHKQKGRRKRAASSKKICEIKAVADHTFFEQMGSNVDTTIAEMMYQIGESNEIFRTVDFNGDTEDDNIRFHVASIKIYKTQASQDYYFSSTNYDAGSVLWKFSNYNHGDACLALLFIHRDFRGVVGVAYLGSTSSFRTGGLCGPTRRYGDGFLTYNTLMITTLSYGNIRPILSSTLTLCHEFGHSFGSDHDSSSDNICTPGGTYGMYLMYPYAKDGSRPNHKKFSPCSVMQMGPVVAIKGTLCMKETTGPTCGNSIIEAGEECDCGTDCDSNDHCCNPADASNNAGCLIRRASGAVCSPKTSICCNSMCQPLQNNETLCRAAGECTLSAFCSGNSSVCPPGENLPDGTPCDDGRKICHNGECSKSVCELKQYQECQCTSYSAFHCQICCKCESTNGLSNQSPCVPASKLGITHSNGSIIYLASGQSCNNYDGYCNQQHICEHADPNADINDPEKDNLLQVLKKIGQNYWYFTILFITVLVVLIRAIQIRRKKCDAKRNKSGQNKKINKYVNHVEEEISALQQQLRKINKKYHAKVEHLGYHTEMDAAKAVGRLSTLFPTASKDEIVVYVRDSANEEQAVKVLLSKGFPIRKLFENDVENSSYAECTEVEILNYNSLVSSKHDNVNT